MTWSYGRSERAKMWKCRCGEANRTSRHRPGSRRRGDRNEAIYFQPFNDSFWDLQLSTTRMHWEICLNVSLSKARNMKQRNFQTLFRLFAFRVCFYLFASLFFTFLLRIHFHSFPYDCVCLYAGGHTSMFHCQCWFTSHKKSTALSIHQQ